MTEIQTRAIPRKVWQAEAEWQATTAIYTGGDARFENNADMALLRDCDGHFYIPGASLRGAARAWLRKKYGEETSAVRALFGDDFAGLLFTFDAPASSARQPNVRDHVRIDPSRRTAAEEGKFNREVLPRGAKFRLRFRVIVPLTIPQWDSPVTEADLESVFRDMLEGFSKGEIRLGGKRTRGSGYGKVPEEGWELYRWNMEDRASLLAWLAGNKPAAEKLSDLTAAPEIDNRKHTRLKCDLRLATSLLIRSSEGDPRSPDMVHLKEGGEHLLPFTSLCGPLRHHCQAIADGLLGGANGIVDRMFGPVGDQNLFASRVSGPDAALRQVQWLVQTRVSIDRFTGAALDAALFDEAALWPSTQPDPEGHVHIELELDETCRGKDVVPDADRMVALLLAGFKDLWLGWLPIGGEAGVGRGVFRGVRATIERSGHNSLTIDESGKVQGWNPQWDAVMASLEAAEGAKQ